MENNRNDYERSREELKRRPGRVARLKRQDARERDERRERRGPFSEWLAARMAR